jgi:hypothetical protein
MHVRLAPKAGIDRRSRHVRFVPETAVSNRSKAAIVSITSSASASSVGHIEAERLGSPDIEITLLTRELAIANA